jgi:thioredoxin 1
MQRLSSHVCHARRHAAMWHVAVLMLLGASLVGSGCGKPPETTRDTTVQTPVSGPETADNRAVPTTGLPKLIDLGAGKCIPCKKMAPILDELKGEYAGALEVVFIDVWENSDAGKEYGIQSIPTQIFYDAAGKELFRHEGFFSKEDILAKWKELGVELPAKSS